MDTPTRIHLIGGLAVSILAVLSLLFEWSSCFVAMLLLVIDLYLVAILIEAARRIDLCNAMAAEMQKLNKDQAEITKALKTIAEGRCLRFPSHSWSMLQILFVLIAVVSGFAAMYIQSGGIANTEKEVLKCWIDGVYFSMVTITTLGYGDFAPTCSQGRLLVIWQLCTGFLLLLGIFPLVVARLSEYK